MVLLLPDHIIEIIFSKLPISYLPICRLVCRAWNDLVSNSKSPISNGFLAFTIDFSHSTFTNSNSKIHCVDTNTLSSVASLEFKKRFSFHSSCNGLLFVIKRNQTPRAGLLNPMTNEFFKVPGVHYPIYNYGFGFSPKTKKYKLFRACTQVGLTSRGMMEVLRFGTYNHQWSLIHSDPPFVEIHGKGAYLNGAVYWIAMVGEAKRSDECVIYTIDVETEKVESSVVLKIGCFPLLIKIEPLNGTIYAIVHVFEQSSRVQVWRMQDKDSWVRDFVVDDNKHGYPDARSFYMIRVQAFEDGGILVLMKGVYYCLDKMGRKMKIKPFDLNNGVLDDICHISSFNFGSLPNILGEHD